MNTHQKGSIGHLQVALRAFEKGFNVCWPMQEARYDLILDDGKSLIRTQVKYCDRVNNGVVTVGLRTQCRNNGYSRNYSQEEVDLVIIFIPSLGKFAQLKPELFVGKTAINLRFERAKNNQSKGCVLLEDVLW